MINLPPSYDCAITSVQNGLSVRFAHLPDLEIAKALCNLPSQSNGIMMLDDDQDGTGYGLGMATTSKPEKQRLYYWIRVMPLFECEQVARAIANYLTKNHRLSVRLIVETSLDQPDLVQVFVPKKET